VVLAQTLIVIGNQLTAAQRFPHNSGRIEGM
jgi:hypothetical protein